MNNQTDAQLVPIAEMELNARFSGPFCISNAQIGRTRSDKPYLRCLLSDASAKVPGRMWGADEALLKRLPADGFVHVAGETQPYQGELQLIIHTIDPYQPSTEELRHLIPASSRPADEMFDDLSKILRSLTHPAALALAEAYLDDDMLMQRFKQAPAAMAMHHAYLSGLLEHTLSLLNAAEQLLPLYPKINRDIVLLGLFLHDLGKTHELTWDGPFDYSDRGLLIGHIVDGAIMLHDTAQQVMRERGIRFPQGFITILEHIIISHHGVPEFGAAKHPATPEAIFVSMLDNFDARMAMVIDAARSERSPAQANLGGNFTERVFALNNTRIYRPDPLA